MITLEPPRAMADDPDPWGTLGLSRAGLSRFVENARNAVGLDGHVDVLLAGDATLKRLNRTWRGKNTPTDVLSFPAADVSPSEPVAGDLAISLETAARQAAEHGHSLRDEIRILLLHGVLHLAGYDHEQDAGEMAKLEAELRRRLRLPRGLIARSEAHSAATVRVARRAASKGSR